MAHRCPMIDARARFRGPIGMVELPNLIFSKLSHLPHAADFRARSNSGASWAVCCACVYPPKVVLLRYRAHFLTGWSVLGIGTAITAKLNACRGGLEIGDRTHENSVRPRIGC